ncbi:hypothetical protein Sipo8835_16180 [Streptomyces ipomoeae]|jgi:hypothetical protein|uniref:Uncharacterized protein n=1 Tax=Streptomyces ipomoeae TaxID=103232 RepID=A0A540PU19_9ACTN|nr:hypothetical protein [Streptomyces ipomoeae]MDX2828228.1 hypothetical protein [Streptomyces ipomoeae]MDX2879446.1 hypothetical protein [Streptomyces ipomoeae]MDX2935926.1 hypothetical protein [Streptomyces ipomoeae]TQE26679.1 hypothetical protein SipoB123_13800 [Streptomyces ipomoeae]TQE34055.1 hypothetical protein Sipo8835_16180 [Streptomyces ipomoeae]
MPQRAKGFKGFQDLVVFLAVLGTGTVLVLRGIAPESLATIAVAVSGLYAAWRGNGEPPRSPAPLSPPPSPPASGDDGSTRPHAP